MGQVFDDPINCETILKFRNDVKVILTDDLAYPNFIKHRGVIQARQGRGQLNQELRLVSSHPVLA